MRLPVSRLARSTSCLFLSVYEHLMLGVIDMENPLRVMVVLVFTIKLVLVVKALVPRIFYINFFVCLKFLSLNCNQNGFVRACMVYQCTCLKARSLLIRDSMCISGSQMTRIANVPQCNLFPHAILFCHLLQNTLNLQSSYNTIMPLTEILYCILLQ